MAIFMIMRVLGNEPTALGRVLPKAEPTHGLGWLSGKNGGNMANSYRMTSLIKTSLHSQFNILLYDCEEHKQHETTMSVSS